MEGTQEVTKPPQSILQQPNPKLRSKFCKHFYLHVGMRPLCKFKEAVSVKCAGKGDTRRGRWEFLPSLIPSCNHLELHLTKSMHLLCMGFFRYTPWVTTKSLYL